MDYVHRRRDNSPLDWIGVGLESKRNPYQQKTIRIGMGFQDRVKYY